MADEERKKLDSIR